VAVVHPAVKGEYCADEITEGVRAGQSHQQSGHKYLQPAGRNQVNTQKVTFCSELLRFVISDFRVGHLVFEQASSQTGAKRAVNSGRIPFLPIFKPN